MLDWKQFLRNRAPRPDLDETFYPELVEDYEPALVNTMPMLGAAAVAARLLYVIALRGGTRIKPSAAEKLQKVVEKALPREVVNHCKDEAARVLDWLENPPSPEDVDGDADIPELAIMHRSDVENRIGVATYAADHGLDVELEYFDEERGVWPRLRATPKRILDEDDETLLELESPEETLEIPMSNIRWMMPVQPVKRPKAKKPPGATILEFPGKKNDD